MTLIKIISATAPGPEAQRIRMWLPTGLPAVLGKGVRMTLYTNRYGEDHSIPCAEVVTSMQMPIHHELAPERWLDLTQYCGALMMVRAAEIALPEGSVTRYFVEYALVDRLKLFLVKGG